MGLQFVVPVEGVFENDDAGRVLIYDRAKLVEGRLDELGQIGDNQVLADDTNFEARDLGRSDPFSERITLF